jgi:hypothetical protein
MKTVVKCLVVAIAGLVIFVFASDRFVLNSRKLKQGIERNAPSGSSKAQVMGFMKAQRPVALDDLGSQVKVRLSGQSENLIYRKDVVLTFDFDTSGRLVSYSAQEYLTFF